jgi:hypothetical protein
MTQAFVIYKLRLPTSRIATQTHPLLHYHLYVLSSLIFLLPLVADLVRRQTGRIGSPFVFPSSLGIIVTPEGVSSRWLNWEMITIFYSRRN